MTLQNTPRDDNKSREMTNQGKTEEVEPKEPTVARQDPEQWAEEITYMGEGEWNLITDDRDKMSHTTEISTASTLEILRLEIEDEDLMKAKLVREKGYPNMYGAKIPVKTKLNVDKLEELLKDYEDKEVVNGLRYGWPTGRLPTMAKPQKKFKNHKGATDHPAALKKYIEKEKQKGAILGPYRKIPFKEKVGISPISTRPKRNTTDRRVIIDLSFPPGRAVNDGMIKSNYLGFTAEIKFPRTDDLAMRVAYLGRGAAMFKIDLFRYFRQLPLDPGDYSMVGYIIDGELYFDKVLPMGMRSAPYIAQRVTNAIRYIHERLHFFLLNYVDDFLGAEHKNKVQQAFQHLTQLLEQLKIDTAPEKIIPPTTRIEFLGVTFDSISMTIEVTKERVQEMLWELNQWNTKSAATRKELESLIGKLQFASKCIKPGRTFISRLLQWLRTMDRKGKHPIPTEARKDMAWWGKCLENYNGVSILWLTRIPEADRLIATDACPKGYGAVCGEQYLHGTFPPNMRKQNIAYLEMLGVLAALNMWTKELRGKYFWIHIDNEAVATVLNTGAARDPMLQNALREILMIASNNEFMIKAKHIRGVDNRIPDWLSRWGEPEARKKFRQYAREKSMKKKITTPHLINLSNQW